MVYLPPRQRFNEEEFISTSALMKDEVVANWKNTNVPFIDATEALMISVKDQNKLKYLPGGYFSALGAKLMADKIAKFFPSYLKN